MKRHTGRITLRRGGDGGKSILFEDLPFRGRGSQLSDTAHQLSVFVHLYQSRFLKALPTKAFFLGIAIDINPSVNEIQVVFKGKKRKNGTR